MTDQQTAAALSDQEQQALVAAIARATVTDVAPEELPLFEPMSEAYFDHRRHPDTTRTGEMLGFGIDAAQAAVLVTPVVLQAAQGVVSYLVTEIGSAFKEEAGPRIRAIMRKVLGGDATPDEQPKPDARKPEEPEEPDKPKPERPKPDEPDEVAWSKEQLDEVHRVAVRALERSGVKGAKATMVADAIVGAIVR
jgi:hypothetical protein